MTLTGINWSQPAVGQSFPETVSETVNVTPGSLGDADAATERASAASNLGRVQARHAGTTEPVTTCADFWFTGLGVVWEEHASADVDLLLRSSADGVTFSPREEFHADGTHGPDPDSSDAASAVASAENGAPFVWTGEATCVRWSLKVAEGADLSNVRIMFVNSSGTAGGPGTAPEESSSEAGFGTDSAEAWTQLPLIRTRDDWGARDSLNRCNPSYADELKMAFVHHTDGGNAYSKNQVDDILRGIHAYHTNGRKWCDIAYNFLIDKFGRIWEGRKGGITEPVVSAATQGVNTGSASVALLGSYTRRKPTAVSLRALKRLLSWRLDIAHVAPNVRTTMISSGGDNTKYDNGDKVRLRTISGHRDTGYTDCPGGKLYRRLGAIRKGVTKMGLPKIYGPTASPTSLVQGSEDTIRFKARGSSPLQWTVEIAEVSTGNVIRTINASGDTLGITWRGNDQDSNPAAVGSYDATIRGEKLAGPKARPATLRIRVKAS